MPAAKGMHSYGAGLYWSAFGTPIPPNVGTLAQWGEISDVISMNGIPVENTVTDVTHLRSPNKAKEKVPGFYDSGQLTVRLNYHKSILDAIHAIRPGSGFAPDTDPSWGRLQFAVLLPDRGLWYMTGFIKSEPIEVPEDGRNTVEITIELSGMAFFISFA